MRLSGSIELPGDKSIAHRAVIISALSRGKTLIHNFPTNKDCSYTLQAFRKLAIKIKLSDSKVLVQGRGLNGLKKPKLPIYMGDSGTSFRLLLGVLAGQNFSTKLICGDSLSRRPMLRVNGPLRLMGAKIKARLKDNEEYAPIEISGGSLKPVSYEVPVASAQVKSALLLAGLYAQGETEIIEPVKTRDHTERMLKLFKAKIRESKNRIRLEGRKELASPGAIYVPGDLSSAAFFMVLAALTENSKIKIKNVSLNPSRVGIIKALKRMRAEIMVSTLKGGWEPAGEVIVKSSQLRATVIEKEEIPDLIDELPILMVAASLAKGRSIFKGAGELRVKETDRINSMLKNLKKMGAKIRIIEGRGFESIVIDGVEFLKGAKVKSFGDHRTAMSMIVAGLVAKGNTEIDDVFCIKKSFPNFIQKLKAILR